MAISADPQVAARLPFVVGRSSGSDYVNARRTQDCNKALRPFFCQRRFASLVIGNDFGERLRRCRTIDGSGHGAAPPGRSSCAWIISQAPSVVYLRASWSGIADSETIRSIGTARAIAQPSRAIARQPSVEL
jgi:hypothetical protein